MPQRRNGQERAEISYFPVGNALRLYYEWWIPKAPKAILVVAHGVGEHSGRYGPLARYFFQRGYGVALFDMRGHGQSEGRRGHFDHFQDLLGDLAAFVQRTKTEFPEVPVFLVGHSFGGQLALNFVVRYSKGLRGLILSSPNIGLKLKMSRWQRWFGEAASRWVPRMRFPQHIDGALLTHDATVAQAYNADPKVLRAFSFQSAHEALRNADIVMALASRIHLPSFFLHAGEDHVCDAEATRQFYRRIPVGRKRLKVYDGMFHELFNEVDNVQVFADVAKWLDEILAEDHAMRFRAITTADAYMDATRHERGEPCVPSSG